MPLSGRNRDQQLCQNEPYAPPGTSAGMALTGMAGKDEKDRRLQTLRPVYEEMSLWTEYAGSAGKEL